MSSQLGATSGRRRSQRDFIEMPARAAELNWVVTTTEPDFFGDVRSTAVNGFGDTVIMVFGTDGKLSGGYLRPRRGHHGHTERPSIVEEWLSERNVDLDA